MKQYFIIILILISIGIALVVAAENLKGEKSFSWRYKMTVEIETPEGLKTGSAVREVTVHFIPNPSAKSGYNDYVDMKGEAVVVDLGQKGKIFAVQNFQDHARPFYLFDGPPGRTIKGAEFYSKLQAKAEIDPKQYPMFVSFKDINDPLSVQLVYGEKANDPYKVPPYIFQDNFEKIYGSGYKLKRVIIEMTDEPVTYKIKALLPWLTTRTTGRLDGNRYGRFDAENRLANRLSLGSFTNRKEK